MTQLRGTPELRTMLDGVRFEEVGKRFGSGNASTYLS